MSRIFFHQTPLIIDKNLPNYSLIFSYKNNDDIWIFFWIPLVFFLLFWQVTKEVEKRIEDLTHQVHREILARCVEQVKTLAPILICSMKIFIQIIIQGKGSFTYYVSTLRGEGGQKFPKICLFIVLKLLMRGGRGSKISKNMLT